MTAGRETPARTFARRIAGMTLPAAFTVVVAGERSVEITDLEAPDPGKGQGRETMAAILALSEETGVSLKVWPVPDDAVEDGLDQTQLRAWYARLGFLPIPNRDPDEDRTTDRHLVRVPASAPEPEADADEDPAPRP